MNTVVNPNHDTANIVYLQGAISALESVETLMSNSDENLTLDDVFQFIQDFKIGLMEECECKQGVQS